MSRRRVVGNQCSSVLQRVLKTVGPLGAAAVRRLARMGGRYSRIREQKHVLCPPRACIQVVTIVTVAFGALSSHNVSPVRPGDEDRFDAPCCRGGLRRMAGGRRRHVGLSRIHQSPPMRTVAPRARARGPFAPSTRGPPPPPFPLRGPPPLPSLH